MINNIFNFLKFLEKNGVLPSEADLNISKDELVNLIKKCQSEGLIDKQELFIDITGGICSNEPQNAITLKGYEFLENYNPLNKVNG